MDDRVIKIFNDYFFSEYCLLGANRDSFIYMDDVEINKKNSSGNKFHSVIYCNLGLLKDEFTPEINSLHHTANWVYEIFKYLEPNLSNHCFFYTWSDKELGYRGVFRNYMVMNRLLSNEDAFLDYHYNSTTLSGKHVLTLS